MFSFKTCPLSQIAPAGSCSKLFLCTQNCLSVLRCTVALHKCPVLPFESFCSHSDCFCALEKKHPLPDFFSLWLLWNHPIKIHQPIECQVWLWPMKSSLPPWVRFNSCTKKKHHLLHEFMMGKHAFIYLMYQIAHPQMYYAVIHLRPCPNSQL